VSFTKTPSDTITYYQINTFGRSGSAEKPVNWRAVYAMGGIPWPEEDLHVPRLSVDDDESTPPPTGRYEPSSNGEEIPDPLGIDDCHYGTSEERTFDFYDDLNEYYDDILADILDRDVEEQRDEWRSEVRWDNNDAYRLCQHAGDTEDVQ
jgi:hypothetical protein